MSFEKKEWKYGDTITADELNRLEGGVEEALDKGYSCTEERTTLTDESVTTIADDDMNRGALAYSTPIDADTIKVTFNGTEYVCDAQYGLMSKTYGAPMEEDNIDWSEYPFQIISGLNNSLCTESAGTYQIKIDVVEKSVETSECFKKAVKSINSCNSKTVTVPFPISNTIELVECTNSEALNFNDDVATHVVETSAVPSKYLNKMSIAGFEVEDTAIGQQLKPYTIQKVIPQPSKRNFQVMVTKLYSGIGSVPAGGLKIYALCYKSSSTREYKLCSANSNDGVDAPK